MTDEPSKHMYTGIGGGTLTKQPDEQMVSLYLIKRIDALDERIARFETGQYHEMVNLIEEIKAKCQWIVNRQIHPKDGFGLKDSLMIFDICCDINNMISKMENSQ